jgi:hypothetical protein
MKIRSLFIALAAAALAAAALAAEVRLVGTVSSIQMAADGKSATVVMQDAEGGADVTLIVLDDETLDKFKDQRITRGDEIRVKYDNGTGRNISKTFRKTAGC